jgi:hypothetical protein
MIEQLIYSGHCHVGILRIPPRNDSTSLNVQRWLFPKLPIYSYAKRMFNRFQ